MRFTPWLLAAGAVALLAGAAQAQGASEGVQGGMAPDSAAAPSAASAPASGALGSPEHPIPQNSPTPADQAFHLKAGDASVVSNAPVPDTPQNRAQYGQPMSHGGKATQPAGN